MSNPLIAKWEELYGQKKEEPKKIEMTGTTQISEQQMDVLSKYLKNSKDYSVSITTPTGVDYYADKVKVGTSNTSKITSYDPYSGEDSFLQIAEKVKSKDARVTSVTLNRDVAGHFYTGRTTIAFEVEVWNT